MFCLSSVRGIVGTRTDSRRHDSCSPRGVFGRLGYIRLFKKMPVSAVGRGTWGVAKRNVGTDICKRTAILVQYIGAL